LWRHTASHARFVVNQLREWAHLPVYFGKSPACLRGPGVIVLPCSTTTLACGLAGLITVYRNPTLSPPIDATPLEALVHQILPATLTGAIAAGRPASAAAYLGGDQSIAQLARQIGRLKEQDAFVALYREPETQARLKRVSEQLAACIDQETLRFQELLGRLETSEAELIDQRLEKMKDTAWSLGTELLDNIAKVAHLMADDGTAPDSAVKIYRNLNAVLNSMDRLEVRGRDSAGVSLLFIVEPQIYQALQSAVQAAGLTEELDRRSRQTVLVNRSVSIHPNPVSNSVGITLTYKVAAEIGSLGDNMAALRAEIARDGLLRLLTRQPHRFHTVSAHTRWASVGAITIANCHPVDNAVTGRTCEIAGIIHACLNGDIDNYLELKKEWETGDHRIPDEITTDTKIIPLQIEKHLNQGLSVEEAFRAAVNDFEGSHAIAMHTDLAPGKFFLAQRGSGQAVFVGLGLDHYLPASEVYGFIEETSRFLKLNGEKVVEGAHGPTQGQIFVLDQNSAGGLAGIHAMYYDGTPIALTENDIQTTAITSRDIDRQLFSHYFLKEISESPLSAAKTLQNRWKIDKDDPERYAIALDGRAFPSNIAQALTDGRIGRIYLIGQGTASIAAQVTADILSYYLNDPKLKISALKASELSGFQLGENTSAAGMADALVIAITQSGTTTDTNRAVDMVRERGAHTVAIVNRRDSDITFKVDGVVYTSSGRDIEMSVASTKAFYSQIVAGALLSLKIAQIMQRRGPAFITDEIKALLALPDQMRKVLTLKERIKASADRLATTKTYWAAVGSGPNKAAADEIRIKLSELCYKTISSDFVEDKKHIDLSSEPLIIVCAAGAGDTVIGDIVKDTAIFKAHKATPVVITEEGETRFDPYAADVIAIPAAPAHLAPVLNTLAGHLWGYYAALAINDGSLFLHRFREEIHHTIDRYAHDGLDVYEVVLEKAFREKVAHFYAEFRQRQVAGQLPTIIAHSADLMLLLKYLSGRLPVSDFELDFGKKGTALNMLNTLFELLGKSINGMSRPVDAIKHQAKTVTVGTSRISAKIEGLLFDALTAHGISTSQLINRNIMVLKNLQAVIAAIHGSILYKIGGLNLLGDPTDDTVIEVLRKEGVLKALPSRVEKDSTLKGTKRIVAREGNVYIGKGRKDDRSIVLIPAIAADSNRIALLLLLNVGFRESVPLTDKIKALGGKYEHIKNIVQENSLVWEDGFLERVRMDELFGRSAEKIAERIVSQIAREEQP
jgi:glucosamine--fructose-6-phosphate aminotransferase (isomerizing)